MASVSYGLNRNATANPDNVLVGTLAVTTNDVEVRIDDTKGLTSLELEVILDAIKNKILDGRTTRIGGAV